MTSPAPNRAPAPTGALACGPAAASSVGESLPERIGTHEAIAALTYDAVLVAIWGFLYLPPLFR